MKKMMALISALAVLMIAFSGCVGDNKSAVNGTESNDSEANVNPAENAANISELNTPAVNGTETSSTEANVNPAESAANISALDKSTVSGTKSSSSGTESGSSGTDSSSSEANVNSDEGAADISEIENLPAGFEYVASIPLNSSDIRIDYNADNVSEVVGGSEGLYKYNDSDIYVDVIELQKPEATNNLIDAYKSSFVPLTEGSRFVEESFNGHSAVRITDHVVSAGTEVPRYSYIWSNGNYVLVVTGNIADSSLIKQLAEATGY